jgi:hypothetical protein
VSVVLVVNSGSSSFKYQLLDMDAEAVLASGLVERIGEGVGRSKHTVTAPGGRDSATFVDATYTREIPIPDHTAGFAVMLEAFAENGPSLEDRPPRAVGHRVVHGGARFFEPTVITQVRANMLVAREETFGPVAPVFAFKDEKEAIRLANDTEFGLASYFYTRDLARAWRVAEALEYGIVGLNTGIISTEVAPFGGIKESGMGREGSKYGILDYTEMKYLCIGGIEA